MLPHLKTGSVTYSSQPSSLCGKRIHRPRWSLFCAICAGSDVIRMRILQPSGVVISHLGWSDSWIDQWTGGKSCCCSFTAVSATGHFQDMHCGLWVLTCPSVALKQGDATSSVISSLKQSLKYNLPFLHHFVKLGHPCCNSTETCHIHIQSSVGFKLRKVVLQVQADGKQHTADNVKSGMFYEFSTIC